MKTQCQHETVYQGRCMDCCQKVSRKAKRGAATGKVIGGKLKVFPTPLITEQQDYDATIAGFEQMTGRY